MVRKANRQSIAKFVPLWEPFIISNDKINSDSFSFIIQILKSKSGFHDVFTSTPSPQECLIALQDRLLQLLSLSCTCLPRNNLSHSLKNQDVPYIRDLLFSRRSSWVRRTLKTVEWFCHRSCSEPCSTLRHFRYKIHVISGWCRTLAKILCLSICGSSDQVLQRKSVVFI